MTKLKCWKKGYNGKTLINYTNGDNKVVIEKPDKDSQWTVTDEGGYRKSSLSSSKSIALKKANKYMKEHDKC